MARSFSRGAWLALALGVWLGLPARGNPVLDWDALMLDAIRTETTGPTLSSRNLAILHVAIYDAVNAIARTHLPYAVSGDEVEVPENTSLEAAVNGASRRIMNSLYPSFSARTEGLFEIELAELPATASTTNGLALGTRVAEIILEMRSDDGANTQVPYIPSAEPGQWRRTPPFFRPPLDPHWRYVDLFGLPDKDSFLPPPPPAMTSAEYTAAFNEVKILGEKNSTVRTPDQTQIAVFWSDFSYTAMPPGHWHEIAATIVRTRNTSLEGAARLFALLSVAQADAAIVCWEAKFRYNTWRPITAIQRADEDGNPDTAADPAWDHLLAAPPFPEYTSGHSTFSKASAQVLTYFFGTDEIDFTTTSDSLPGVFRSFNSLAACADEVGMSRIYGGIHFQFANLEGKASGKRIGDWVDANLMLDLAALPLVRVEGRAANTLRVRVHGVPGQSHVVETSADLVHWSGIATNTAVLGGVVLETDLRSGPTQFFRARTQ